MRSSGRRWLLVLLTIVAIVGTLCGCGRYGRPKRPVPEPAAKVAGLVIPVPLPLA